MPEIKLVGIKTRTNNAGEFTKDAQIPTCIQDYFSEQIPNKITQRKNEGITFCVYTKYESDHTGNYTFYIGEEVIDTKDEMPDCLKKCIIPQQTYIKFTTKSGPMPDVVIQAWQEIWKMTPKDLGGQRNYCADFEVYDERAKDPQNTILDLYIGIDV